IILYTDGVTEAFNEEKQQFGEKGLEKTLKSVPGADSKEIIEAITEDVAEFSGNEPQNDDITILPLKRLK
ncbi:MAG: serine/threonine-protein phosphatase, partial [Bacteroides sp.]|nr:serine/threonine-protein phosphatase [Bacteroides sp.]